MSNTVEPGLAKSTGIISVAAGVCGFGNCICGFIWLGYKGYGGHGLWSGFGVSLSYNFSYSSILCSVGNVGISKAQIQGLRNLIASILCQPVKLLLKDVSKKMFLSADEDCEIYFERHLNSPPHET